MNDRVARSPGQLAFRRFVKNRRAVACGALLILIGAATLLIPMVSKWDYRDQDYDAVKSPPDSQHWMGTDTIGRDLMSRVFFGGRISFQVGILATLISVAIGILYGSVAGFAGGRMDSLMMRFVDVLYGLPYMLIVIIVMSFLETRSLVVVFLVLGLFSWLTMARIVRGQVLSLKEQQFVEAARALGARTPHIIARHLLPNLVGPVIVYATLSVPSIILSESFLSFLGLGVSQPETSWGKLISEGAAALSPVKSYWWLVAFPGVCLAVTLFCLNAVGDGLRDAFDVRSRD